MLGLAYAARHPGSVTALVIVSCGTWDARSRECLEQTRASRMNADLRGRLERLSGELSDPDEFLRVAGDLFLELDSWNLIDGHHGFEAWDARANLETWNDMVRLQEAGLYPSAFAGIRVPVLMLHGREDPHPGPMIRASLQPHLPQLEYREWTRCGHYPWLEKAVRGEFLETLKDWVEQHCEKPFRDGFTGGT
jgi:pimeloyl-ACP methyl ester carboxylesterase